ncbi:hypothetical protein HDU67_004174 [Dinochytrium kinnereticum]|nr:hypothetical protein HDU67_004174 [Dinochytrium kinnereticum]
MDPSSLPDTSDQFAVWMPTESLIFPSATKSSPASVKDSLERFHWLPRQETPACRCHFSRIMSETITREIFAEVIRRKLRKALLLPPIAKSSTPPTQSQTGRTSAVPRPVANMWRHMVEEAVEIVFLSEVHANYGESASNVPDAVECDMATDFTTGRGRADSGVGGISEADDESDFEEDRLSLDRVGAVRRSRASGRRGEPYSLISPKRRHNDMARSFPVFSNVLHLQNYVQDILSHLG